MISLRPEPGVAVYRISPQSPSVSDLQWLKHQANNHFADQRGIGDLRSYRWPHKYQACWRSIGYPLNNDGQRLDKPG